jgi:hypothetical protein
VIDQKKIEHRLRKIMKGPTGDRCSVCRMEFGGTSRLEGAVIFPVFGGTTKDGTVVLVGTCCRSALTQLVTCGIYLPPDEPPAWKKDDAAWFEGHPRRTHRLRRACQDEIKYFLAVASENPLNRKTNKALLNRCEHYVVVRQIESGKRMRLPTFWGMGAVLPETEEFAHALFDFLAKGKEGTIFHRDDIEVIAKQYQTGAVS